MAVVTVKSTQVTNRDASPPVMTNGNIRGANVRHARASLTITSGDDIASKYIAFPIPSNAVPLSLQISSPDIGTTTITDVGLYKTTRDGSAVVDADFFASALSLKDGALAFSEILRESGVITIGESEEMIWQLLDLTSDPSIDYDVVCTLTAAADATGVIMLEMYYTV